jgi:hypothetical protein
MPSSWGCNMMYYLHKHTGWDNILALQDNPARNHHGYLVTYMGTAKNPTGRDRLHAVCARAGGGNGVESISN